jgi:hypothetical protein
VERGGVSKVFDIFNKTENQDTLPPQQIRICLYLESHHLALGGYPALHQQSTREKDQKSGIDLILGIIPHLLQLNFELLFLVYLILVFRISELLCKAIKLRIEDEPRVRFWVLYAATVKETYS